MPLGTGGWNQYLQLSRWVYSMDYLQLWKEGCVSRLPLWSYSTVCWKGHFLWNFKLAGRFTNRPISAKLKSLNKWLIAIDGLLSGALMLSRCSILSAAQEMLFSWMLDRHLCVREPSEDLSKTAKAKCAWIITPSFNCNRKFLMNKNTCLNMSEAAEIDEHWLNSLTNVMRIPTPFLAPVFKGDESDCLLH